MAISAARYDAVLFDLDGVLTPTAKIHAACWKHLFDNFLEQYYQAAGRPFQPFDIQKDYKLYVDGKPRYEGIKSFLASRKIDLSYGDKAFESDEMTVLELGRRKDKYFEETLQAEGIAPCSGVVSVVQQLRAQGLKTAVVSSSRNCKLVLAAADIIDLFDSIMDGQLAEQLHLAGKPEPDTFLEAAKQVGAVAKRSVVVEDAIAGVQAGRKGKFGWVVGLARDGDASALAKNGADIVISNLSELLT